MENQAWARSDRQAALSSLNMEAERCRRLASAVSDEGVAATLTLMAVDYELQARALDTALFVEAIPAEAPRATSELVLAN